MLRVHRPPSIGSMSVSSTLGALEKATRVDLELKSFSLTHILYDPSAPKYLSIPLTLLSLSPIFLFVSYFTLLVFGRRFSLLLLALGSIGNEVVSWGLKRLLKGERPYVGTIGLGEGYGMPSSHSQAAGFLAAWGVGYSLTLSRRSEAAEAPLATERTRTIRNIRTGVYAFGLVLWSLLTAYSRYYLRYHDAKQILAGYAFGVALGSLQFVLTEYVPLYRPGSLPARIRRYLEWLWTGVGGVSGWDLGGEAGGWGEGHFLQAADSSSPAAERKRK